MKISKKLKRQLRKLFESQEKIDKWLNSQIIDLNGKTPLEILKQKEGEKIILKLLRRIEHGIPS